MQMMGHMMQHMRVGMAGSAEEGMQCPMMSEMMQMSAPSGDEPPSHEH